MTKVGRDELRVAAICLLRNPNLTCTEIASRLNVGKTYVWRVQAKYCPERRADRYCSGPDHAAEAVKERRETIGRLLGENVSVAEIARQVNMDATTVTRIQKKHYPEIPLQVKKPNRPRW
jgi:transposase